MNGLIPSKPGPFRLHTNPAVRLLHGGGIILLTPELAQRLKAAAFIGRTTMAAIATKAIEAYLDDQRDADIVRAVAGAAIPPK